MRIHLIFIFVFFIFPFGVANSLDFSEIREIDESDWPYVLGASKLNVDSFLILRAPDKKYSINKTIEIVDNPLDFTKVSYKVNSERLIDGNRELKFNNYVVKDKIRNREEWEQHVEYDFISFLRLGEYIRLNLDGFSGNTLLLSHKGKKLYLKISEEHYKESKVDFMYRFLFGKKDQQNELSLRLSKLPDLKKIIENLSACAKAKNESCIYKYQQLDKLHVGGDALNEYLKNNFMKRYILDDPKTCEVIEDKRSKDNADVEDIPFGLDKKVDKTKSKVWDSLNKALSLDLNYNYVKIESNSLKEGINSVLIFKKPRKDLKCGLVRDVAIRLIKIDSKWKMQRLDLGSDHEEIY